MNDGAARKASAIPALMIPQHADWYAVFAGNQQVLMYVELSFRASAVHFLIDAQAYILAPA